MSKRFAAIGAACLLVLMTACTKPSDKAGNVDAARLVAAEADGANWMNYGRTYSEQRQSPLTQVSDANVGQLGLAWWNEFDTDRGQQATPLVVDGVLYTTTAWSKVFAFDAATGKALWSFDPKVPGERAHSACCDVVNRGVAVWGGKAFVGTLDGRLIALDAATGKQVWSVVTVDQSKPYTITGAPRVVKGKVLIGNGGAELGVRGYISAYDADTGKQVWRFYTVPGDPAKGPDGAASDPQIAKMAATWFGDVWKKTGGGGTVWDAMAYDPDLDLLYFGVGNGSPWNRKLRSEDKGDNLFLSSIVAVKPDTGEYVWHYQTTPGETWDYTATQHIMLADLTIDGKPRKVLMQAPKNGFFYVIDRADGKLISAKNFIPISWAKGVDLATGRPIENPEARYPKDALSLVMPGPLGAHNWHPMAFNPKDGLVYIPAFTIPTGYQDEAKFTYQPGAWNVGVNLQAGALPEGKGVREAIRASMKGQLIAWDPIKQEARWTVEHPFSWNGGLLATAGNLLFQGTADGEFTAYSANEGKKLWSYQAGNGIVAAPMTYSVKGEQYVAVMVGYGGGLPVSAPIAGPDRPKLPGRLLVFKLNGKGAPPPAYDIPTKEALDLTGITSAALPADGFKHYMQHCQVCHGASAVGGYLPDLRYSPMILDAKSWQTVVHDGALSDKGMVSFKPWLSAPEIESIRAYIIQESRNLAKEAAAPATAAPKAG